VPLYNPIVIPAATGSSQGGVQLAGDLAGVGSTAAAPTIAATTNVETIIQANRLDQMATPANPVSWGSQKLTSLAAGAASTDASNLSQVPAEWLSTDQGFKAWTGDNVMASSTDLLPATGAIRYATLRVNQNITVTKLYVYVTTGGVGQTTGQCFLALFTGALALLAQSGDMTTAFASSASFATGTISSQNLTPGLYIIGVWTNGGSAPTLAAAPGSSAVANLNLSNPWRWGGTTATATTTAPNPLVPTAVTVPFWAAMA
jgi:hypothetical protein